MKLRRLAVWSNLLFGGLLMFAVWALVVLVASRPALKRVFDLSPGGAFTVDPVTQVLLGELQKQELKVEFHVFFQYLGSPPEDVGQRQRWSILDSLQRQTRDLLLAFGNLGGGAVRTVNYDGADVGKYRVAAAKYGVGPEDTVVVEVFANGKPPRHKRLSLVLDMAVIDDPSTRPRNPGAPRSDLPVLKDFKGEEALASAVKSLLVQGTPVLYVVTSYQQGTDAFSNLGEGYGQLLAALKQEGFEVRKLDLTAGIPDDADAVALFEPRRELAPVHVRTLLDYLHRGGKLYLNYSFHPVDGWNPTGGELGQALGFEIGPDPVFHLIPSRGGLGLDGNPDVARLPLAISSSHPVTSPLTIGRRVLEARDGRELRLKNVTDVRHEGLLQTGPYAWTAASARDYKRPPDDRALQARTIAAAIEVDGKDKAGKAVTGRAIVVSGVLCNNLGMQLNRDFGLNVFQWFAERKELVTVRGERYQAKHFQFEVDHLGRIWWFVVVGVPGLSLLFGIFVAWSRSRT
jgi:hypothetical protein